MSDNVNQFEFERFSAPLLTEICTAGSAFVGCTINRMEDRYASKVGESNGVAVTIKIVKSRINDDFEVSGNGVHFRRP
jgi:hypothetical protein